MKQSPFALEKVLIPSDLSHTLPPAPCSCTRLRSLAGPQHPWFWLGHSCWAPPTPPPSVRASQPYGSNSLTLGLCGRRGSSRWVTAGSQASWWGGGVGAILPTQAQSAGPWGAPASGPRTTQQTGSIASRTGAESSFLQDGCFWNLALKGPDRSLCRDGPA